MASWFLIEFSLIQNVLIPWPRLFAVRARMNVAFLLLVSVPSRVAAKSRSKICSLSLVHERLFLGTEEEDYSLLERVLSSLDRPEG